ncbi:GNAT family N-acetyltransferase [Aspergillus mulundensis]|uniref:N-acetyltransferase domain-containing protein n=1 Tax=Aspergillus mulundensis TaxID=1810919 RepID=A0A3D8S5G9_9EURO|nr:Uncharacterized protein DSM5745_05110 [Aspergillus mulundensis]RDW81553.1 Uncharacterized protein DSM5745_05110 [Aspergillus mulundensis]
MSLATPAPSLILHLLKTNTLIRPFAPTDSDIECLAQHADNPLIAQFMRNAFPHPYTRDAAIKWINFTLSQNPICHFAICDANTNTIIGAIGLKGRDDVQYRSMEVGYWLGQEFWGRGIGSEAVGEFVKWVFGHEGFGHLVRIDAEVFDGNEGSKRVLEKVGFGFEGRRRKAVEKNGLVLDTFVYALLREEL